MASVFVNNVLMLSETSGTSDYEFTGAVAGYATFASQMSAGDVTAYFARDSSAWEVGLAQRATGPERMVRLGVIASSTGSAISWPGSGSREVGGGLPAQYMLWLISASVASGMLVKNGTGSVTSRTMANGTYITWTNASGVAGNPTLVDSGLTTAFLRRNTAASLVAALEMSTGFSLSVNYFTASVAAWNGPSGENMFRWFRNGSQDYDMQLRVGGSSWRDLVYEDAGGLNAADTLGGLDETQIAMATSAGSYYSTSGITISSGGLVSFAHGLGAKPAFVMARVTNTSGEHGYSTGDTIELGTGLAAGNGNDSRGHAVITDTTTVSVRFGGDTTVYDAFHKSTGARVQLSNGSWTIGFQAWK